MNKIHWNGGTLLAPVPPVLVCCGNLNKPNVLTVAWTGIINTIPPKTYVSIRPERYSFNIINNTREFTINLPVASMVRTVDICGVKSGANVDKFKLTGLEVARSDKIDAPIIKNCPLSLECRVDKKLELGSHVMFIADIVGIDVDENLIDPKGKLHLDKADLLAYSHGEYFKLGKKIGSFGFSVRKKKNKQ